MSNGSGEETGWWEVGTVSLANLNQAEGSAVGLWAIVEDTEGIDGSCRRRPFAQLACRNTTWRGCETCV